MEREKIIVIGLLVIILALLVCIIAGMPNESKVDTKLIFKSNDTIDEGSHVKIKLTDVNGTGLENQTVNITVTDENNVSDYHSVVTGEDGDGKVKVKNDPGKYNVTISYAGNENYTACYETQELTINEKVVESEHSSSTSNDGYSLEGPEVDSLGITKEQVLRAREISGNDVKYDAESGIYVMYDPKYGTYHT